MKNILRTAIAICIIGIVFSGCGSDGKTVLKENERIIFLGDSITEEGVRPDGYVTLIAEAIAKRYADLNIKVIGAGISGHKVTNCQRRLESDVLQRRPTIVVIYIGINDVWWWNGRWGKGTTKEDFESGLHDLVERITTAGARVILCTPTVIGEKTDGSNEFDQMLEEYSNISRQVAGATGSQLLDLRLEFMGYLKRQNSDNLERGILTRDGVHLSTRGNVFLSELMLEALLFPEVIKSNN